MNNRVPVDTGDWQTAVVPRRAQLLATDTVVVDGRDAFEGGRLAGSVTTLGAGR